MPFVHTRRGRSLLLLTTAALLALAAPRGSSAQEADDLEAAGGDDAPVASSQPSTGPDSLRIMTMNVEWWRNVFLPKHVLATTRKGLPDDVVEVMKNARADADEENWEIARNVLSVQPDVWVFQEGCEAEDLNWFNTQMLRGYFETVHVFKTNSERGQNTGILVRKGFKVLEFREDYHNEPDTEHVSTYGEGKLFARGPGFAKIQAPNGNTFWVGTNHTKSKSGNSVAVTKWRLAESKRTNQIIADLRKSGPAPVFFLGDMNDELGFQEFEQEAGGSTIEATAGSGENGLLVLTKKLAESGAISYHGRRQGRHKSFIDHAFATPEAAAWVKNVYVFTGALAEVASDHFPVVVEATIPAK